MMRARPSRHTRTIKTRRGMKTVMVNPSIRKKAKIKRKLQWYCNCTENEKCAECQRMEPIQKQITELEKSAYRKGQRIPKRKEKLVWAYDKEFGELTGYTEDSKLRKNPNLQPGTRSKAAFIHGDDLETYRKRQIQRGIRRKSFDEDSDWPFIGKPSKRQKREDFEEVQDYDI